MYVCAGEPARLCACLLFHSNAHACASGTDWACANSCWAAAQALEDISLRLLAHHHAFDYEEDILYSSRSILQLFYDPRALIDEGGVFILLVVSASALGHEGPFAWRVSYRQGGVRTLLDGSIKGRSLPLSFS